MMKGRKERGRLLFSAWVVGLMAMSLALPLAVTGDDGLEMHTERFSAEGRYAIVAAGVGMLTKSSGDIQLHVPGRGVKAAYLYWSGHGKSTSGDNTVSLARDGVLVAPNVVAGPGGTYGPVVWWDGYRYFAYVADVTKVVQPGAHTYTVSGFNTSIYRRDGAGLMVVYEDDQLPASRVVIQDGLDRFFREWGSGPQAESAVNCFTFEPEEADRPLHIALFLGEIYRGGTPRPNALWYRTGTETEARPMDMVNAPTNGPLEGTRLQGPPANPFQSSDGYQWDSYSNALVLPAGHSWACLQVESARYGSYEPASGVWLATGSWVGVHEPPTPTFTPTPTYTPTPTLTPSPTATPCPEPTPCPDPWPPRICFPLALLALLVLAILLAFCAGLHLVRRRDDEGDHDEAEALEDAEEEQAEPGGLP